MSATQHLAAPTRPTEQRRGRGWMSGGAVVAACLAGGALFWGVPSVTSGDELPDPTEMALVGDGRNTSAENVAYWQARVDSVPASVSFRAQLASAQLTLAGDTGDLAGYEVGERTAREAVALGPSDANARLVLAAALAGQHRFAEALALGTDVLDDEPGSVAAWLAVGDAQLAIGQYEAARASFDRAADQVGGVAPVLSRRARLASLTGTLDEAQDLARRALVDAGSSDVRSHDAAFYWFQLATYEYRQGNVDDAFEHLRAALSIQPDHGASQELIAQVYVARGHIGAAIEQYEVLTDGGGAADVHGALAELYARQGRDAEAAEQIELGLAVAAADADRFPAERRHLIGFVVEHDPAEALRLAELDLVDRQDIFAHAWYAWTLHETGDLNGAALAIEPALVYDTEDAELMYQAGVIFASAGQSERAQRLLERALDINPTFGEADSARALLTSR